MALKDWEKTKKGTWKKGDEELSINLASKLTHAKKGYLVISTDYPRKTFEPKYFKTESQALKFAKQYMRTH